MSKRFINKVKTGLSLNIGDRSVALNNVITEYLDEKDTGLSKEDYHGDHFSGSVDELNVLFGMFCDAICALGQDCTDQYQMADIEKTVCEFFELQSIYPECREGQ